MWNRKMNKGKTRQEKRTGKQSNARRKEIPWTVKSADEDNRV